MAELTPNPTPTTSGRSPEAAATGSEPMSATASAPSAAPRTSRPVAAECVRSAHETLANLDQVDFELGSTNPVRQQLRSAALERLARCGPLVVRRCRRLPWRVWRKRVAAPSRVARRAPTPPSPPSL